MVPDIHPKYYGREKEPTALGEEFWLLKYRETLIIYYSSPVTADVTSFNL